MTDEALNELYQLMSAMTDGALDDRQQSQLQELLRGNARAQLWYRDFMALHAQLFLEHTTGVDRNDGVGSSCQPLGALGAPAAFFPADARSRTQWFAQWISRKTSVLAAVALFSLLGLLLLPGGGDRKAATPVAAVGSFSRSANVQWSPGAHRWSVGDALAAGESVAFDSGRVELQFNSGAVMTVVGPAALEIQSANLVALHAGTATTRIENGNSGEFRVVTPTTEVLDLGTEFGVRVRLDGETDVVVFEGKVDVTPVAASADRGRVPQTLSVGEAVCISGIGDWKRLVSIENDAFPAGDQIFPRMRRRPPVIARVADDRRDPSSPNFYYIYHEGLDEDVRAYVDRKHEWNGVTAEGMPHFLRGADYVATFNHDKRNSPEITVELSGPAMVYVLLDDRMPVPDWLSESFENTGYKIGLDEGPSDLQTFELAVGPGKCIDRVCSVWCRRVDRPGCVVLGPLIPLEEGGTMLGIAAQPL